MTTLFIKNMVCNRCIMVVQNELDKLGFDVKNIKLGEVILAKELTSDQKSNLAKALIPLGFEIIDDKKSRIIEQIKEHAMEDVRALLEGEDAGVYINRAKSSGLTVFKMKRIYLSDKSHSLVRTLSAGYKKKEEAIISNLYKILNSTSRIIYDYERRFIELIEEMRAGGIVEPTAEQIERVNSLDDASEQNIISVRELSNELTAVYLLQERLKRTIDRIEIERMKAINEPVDPKVNALKVSTEESKCAAPIDEYQWV